MEFTWNERYDTGIPVIDEQHRELFRLVQDLRRMVQDGTERTQVADLLEHLVVLTERHFVTEETLMGQYDYPDLAGHISEHAAMLSNLRELLAKFHDSHQTMAMLVPTFMEGWLRHHISDGDFGFKSFLRARNLV